MYKALLNWMIGCLRELRSYRRIRGICQRRDDIALHMLLCRTGNATLSSQGSGLVIPNELKATIEWSTA